MADWFRAYNEALDDPKVQRLPGELFKTWFNLLCVASRCGGSLPALGDLAFMLRLGEDEAGGRIAKLVEAGLLDRDGDRLRPHNWSARQYESDTSTDRVRKFRHGRSRHETEVKRFTPVSETAPETEADTDSDPESSSSSAGASAGEIDLRQAKALPTRDLLEAEARALMAELPVVVDVDFSPVRGLLDEPGVTRADVVAGLTEAAAATGFRPVSWRQCAGWVRKAAKNRIAAAASGARTGPPGGARAPPGVATRKPSGLSACLEIARGERPGGFAENSGVGAGAGPVIDGRAVAL